MRKIVFLLLVFLHLLTTAQNVDPKTRNLINNSDFIFEGKPLTSSVFLDNDGKKHVSIVVEIKNVLRGKGQIFQGTIELIKQLGGYHNVMIHLDDTQMFFCKSSDYPLNLNNLKTSNNLKLKLTNESQGSIVLYTDGIGQASVIGPYNNSFNSNTDFYNFIKNFTNITIPNRIVEPFSINALNNKPKPQITSISSTAIAGIGQVVIIKGSGFGTKRTDPNNKNNIGQVQFKNADDGGQSFIKQLDDDDYLVIEDTNGNGLEFWNDNEIWVKCPSSVHKGFPPGSYPSAGTGLIRVKNYFGKIGVSSTKLNIPYSIKNHIDSDNIKRRLDLANPLGTNGFTFTLSSTLKKKEELIFAIEKVLKDWSCELNIALKLERDAKGNLLFESSPYDINKNIIYTANSTTWAMITSPKNDECQSSNSNNGPVEFKNNVTYGANIGINSNTNHIKWSYNIYGNSSSGLTDFYNAFAHEVGHVLGLGHIIDPNQELMHWKIFPISKTFPQRTRIKTGRGNSLKGAKEVIRSSISVKRWCAGLTPLKSSANSCSNTSVSFTSDKTNGIKKDKIKFTDTSTGDITSWYWGISRRNTFLFV